MTIDEVIYIEHENAKEKFTEGMLCHANPNDEKLDECVEKGRYHEQIVAYLEELKSYRMHIFSGDMTQAMLREERNKAIDDLLGGMNQITYNSQDADEFFEKICDLAEQLKEGVSSGTDNQ